MRVELNKGQSFIVDNTPAVREILNLHRFTALKRPTGRYMASCGAGLFHHLLINLPDSRLMVLFINGDTLDCRRVNLKVNNLGTREDFQEDIVAFIRNMSPAERAAIVD
ncbi:MAG: hypothetical protein P4L69_05515 [Desulfosporosinus sp.]|nr:hypothetical protein [Desulfosporosinus sp.]